MKTNKKTTMVRSAVIGLINFLLFGLNPVWAAGSIDVTHKYGWSENSGWQNWRSSHGQATVESDHLKGFIWAENVGWIKLGVDADGPYANTDQTDYGVNRRDDNTLFGYAWGENVGWINFAPTHGGVTIDPATGDFSGYAWGENIGWIKLAGTAQNSSAYKVKVEDAAPSVTTQAATNIGRSTATGNGDITSLGSPNPTAHGVCWSTTANPTTADSCDDKGPASTTGAFTADITGLTSGTIYHVRAYATNAAETAYGEQVEFTTLHEAPDIFLPQDGATVSGTSVTFLWGEVLGATKYHLQVRCQANQQIFKDDATLTGTTVTYDDFPGDGTVFEWQVRAGNQWGVWSALRTFTNAQDTPTPTAIPTMSQWGLIIMSVLMLITGAIMYRRREQGMM